MQCPECKFYKVDVKSHDVEDGRKPHPPSFGDLVGLFIGVAFVHIVVFLFLCISVGVFYSAIVMGISFVVVFSITYSIVSNHTVPNIKTIFTGYECRHCGYRW